MPLEDSFIWIALIFVVGYLIRSLVVNHVKEKREKKKYFFIDYLLEEFAKPLSGSHWLIVPPILLVLFNSNGLLLEITVWIALGVIEIFIFLLLYMGYRGELKKNFRK